jgi:hypothetical protein
MTPMPQPATAASRSEERIVTTQIGILEGAITGFAAATCDAGRCPLWVTFVDSTPPECLLPSR